MRFLVLSTTVTAAFAGDPFDVGLNPHYNAHNPLDMFAPTGFVKPRAVSSCGGIKAMYSGLNTCCNKAPSTMAAVDALFDMTSMFRHTMGMQGMMGMMAAPSPPPLMHPAVTSADIVNSSQMTSMRAVVGQPAMKLSCSTPGVDPVAQLNQFNMTAMMGGDMTQMAYLSGLNMHMFYTVKHPCASLWMIYKTWANMVRGQNVWQSWVRDPNELCNVPTFVDVDNQQYAITAGGASVYDSWEGFKQQINPQYVATSASSLTVTQIATPISLHEAIDATPDSLQNEFGLVDMPMWFMMMMMS